MNLNRIPNVAHPERERVIPHALDHSIPIMRFIAEYLPDPDLDPAGEMTRLFEGGAEIRPPGWGGAVLRVTTRQGGAWDAVVRSVGNGLGNGTELFSVRYNGLHLEIKVMQNYYECCNLVRMMKEI